MILYINADPEFQSWRTGHESTGFIIGCDMWPQPESAMMLHRAECTHTPGWAATAYSKACSTDREELVQWAEQSVKGHLQLCSFCQP
jgi:hypothetical protein